MRNFAFTIPCTKQGKLGVLAYTSIYRRTSERLTRAGSCEDRKLYLDISLYEYYISSVLRGVKT